MLINMILLCVLINDTVTDFSKFSNQQFSFGITSDAGRKTEYAFVKCLHFDLALAWQVKYLDMTLSQFHSLK